MNEERRKERLLALVLAGALGLNYPLLSLMDEGSLLGIPSLYLYLFAIWAVFIALVALLMERRQEPQRRKRTHEPAGGSPDAS